MTCDFLYVTKARPRSENVKARGAILLSVTYCRRRPGVFVYRLGRRLGHISSVTAPASLCGAASSALPARRPAATAAWPRPVVRLAAGAAAGRPFGVISRHLSARPHPAGISCRQPAGHRLANGNHWPRQQDPAPSAGRNNQRKAAWREAQVGYKIVVLLVLASWLGCSA